MKALSQALQTHLDGGTTTLCWCWQVTRTDGAKFGFTDHDEDLFFANTMFEAATGFTASEIDSSVGLNVDNLEVQSVLRSDRLNEKDLAAGLYDNAEVEIYRVNWADPTQNVLMRHGNLGEISRGPHAFTAEIRGLAHELQQPVGRLFQYGCDADLGDHRCKINLNQSSYRGYGQVTEIRSAVSVIVGGLHNYANDWFTAGVLHWTSGANADRSTEIKLHSNLGGVTVIELWQTMSEQIARDDMFSITAGCNKQFSTCYKKFGNYLNFRGFPHIPGNDFATSYPNRDDPSNHGGALS